MSHSKVIKQGDSLNLNFKLDDSRVLTDFTCHLQVRDSDDVLTAIDRAVATRNSDDTVFVTVLTPAETGALALGEYTVSAQLANATTSQAVELILTMTIAKQYNF